jgi:[NiFe] hydrogenase diaphorase moiety small subunit
MCKRCVRTVLKDEKHVFAMNQRGGHHLHIELDAELADRLTETEALQAMDICPVGAIIKKERGYYSPIGQRKYDFDEIGTDLVKKS